MSERPYFELTHGIRFAATNPQAERRLLAFLPNDSNLVLARVSLPLEARLLVADLDGGKNDPIVVRHYDHDIVLVLGIVDGCIADCVGHKALRFVRGAGALNLRHGHLRGEAS